jgi:hypothetical protein
MKNKTLKKVTTLVTALALSVSVLVAAPTTAKAADEAGINSFVTRMYDVCLGRTPDEAGLNDWSSQLVSGEAKGADIAFGFIFSQEFQNMNLCNEHYVDAMYDAFFGRVPDEAGKADWMNRLATGQTRGAVMTGFVNSQEFHNLCASYGITQGEGDWSNDDIPVNGTCVVCAGGNNHEVTAEMRAFAERLYTCCLERDAEEDGLNDWCVALANGATGSEVASGFVFSDEYKLKDASDTQYVLMLYKTMLGREADTPGVTNWVLQLRDGASREVVFNGFLGSAEFAELCNTAGIKVGSAIADNGTTGRQSTGERVTVRDNCYMIRNSDGYTTTDSAEYDFYIEGELVNLADAWVLRPGHTLETEPFIAYEGAVGTIYLYY